MDRVTDHFRGRSEIDPDDDLEALIPTARAIQPILAGRSPCECISTGVRRMTEAMEAIRGLAPQLPVH